MGHHHCIAIIRALVRAPQVLVLDETTSKLEVEVWHAVSKKTKQKRGQKISCRIPAGEVSVPSWVFHKERCHCWVSGAAGGSVSRSDRRSGGPQAEDCGDGRSHNLHRERRDRGGGDARRAGGQERALPSVL